MTGSPLGVETLDHVRVLSLNRPERHNAINHELQQGLWDALADAVADADVRAVLLRGEGPSFSSGFDTGELGQHGDEGTFALGRRVQEGALRRLTCPKPVVVAMRGYALGVGLEIALAGDVRVAASDALLGFPEVVYGLCTDNGGAALAAVLAGPSRAKYLLLSGDRITADVALSWGLVDFVIEPDELDERALAIATQFASRSPMAVHAAKTLVDQVHRSVLIDGLRSELLAIVGLYASEDRLEARAARAEGRSPQFRGR